MVKKEYLVFGLLGAILLFIFLFETSSAAHGLHHNAMMGSFGLGIGTLFFLILLVLGYYLLAADKAEDYKMNLLKAVNLRYAKGEINRDEYVQICKELIEDKKTN